jgi:excisionase family DNA binding protein
MTKLTVDQMARRLGVSRGAVYGAIQAGKLAQSAVQVREPGKKNAVWRIDEATALSEWAQHSSPGDARTPPRLRNKLRQARKEGAGDKEYAPDQSGKKTVPNKAQSDALNAAIKAEMAQLELDEKRGTLVQRAQIDAALFEVGQQFRMAVMALPDRVIDSIYSAEDRDEAHQILAEAIAQMLENLADPVQAVSNHRKK